MELSDYAEISDGEFRYHVRDDVDPEKFADWIQLTAHREVSRISRLRALAVELAKKSKETALRIARLHDHKGLLTVIWAEEPRGDDTWEVEKLWSELGETHENVGHYVPKFNKGEDFGSWDVTGK